MLTVMKEASKSMESEGRMKARILIMNHSQEIMTIIHDLLEDEEYEVETAEVNLIQLTDIEQAHPDLIILDGLFGQQQIGWKLLQHIRTDPTIDSIPIILCTAAENEVHKRIAYLRQQNIPVLFKPFEIDDLIDIVRQVLVPEQHQLL